MIIRGDKRDGQAMMATVMTNLEGTRSRASPHRPQSMMARLPGYVLWARNARRCRHYRLHLHGLAVARGEVLRLPPSATVPALARLHELALAVGAPGDHGIEARLHVLLQHQP